MTDFLWRECAEWMIKQQVLLPDHRVTWPSAQVVDLAYTLRDGVLLCQLANKLAPGCIDMKEVSFRPQLSQFLCLKNIRTFLHACQNVFAISPEDLFEPSMLFDYTDFGKVLNTLSVLSKAKDVEVSGIEGFPFYEKPHDYYNDEIYRNLEEVANQEEELLVPFEFPISHSRSKEEDIYEDLCYVTLRLPKSTSAAQPVHPVEKRDYCVKELMETEKNYIDVLNVLLKHFMRPLKTALKLEDQNIIFMNVKELTEIHTGFHSDLYKACTSSHYKISDCFLHWKEKLIIYGSYCSNLPVAQELIDDLCNRNEIVNQSIIRCQNEANNGKFKLRDLLSVPMQRILKYHLLLKELIKHTPKGHDDFLGLEKALDAMLDLAQYINEVKRDSETLQIIRDIQTSITDLHMPEDMELKDYGRLLNDGDLRIRCHDDNKCKNRYVFVFDKVLLMCKSTRGEQFSFKEALVLYEYKVEDVANVAAGNRDKWSYSWYIVHRQNKSAITMYAKTEELKKKWIEAIEKALDNVGPSSLRSTNHMFHMHTFEKPTLCADCEKLLRGIFYQGYACTVCNAPVHKGCIATVRSCGAPSLPPRPVSEVIVRNLVTHHSPKPYLCKVRAKCSYEGPSDHLSFDNNDEIYVTKKIDNFNWEGYLSRTGKTGVFPSEHVEVRSASCENLFSNNRNTITAPTPDYVNTLLEGYEWFGGMMDREAASQELELLPSGSFLLRISPKQNASYVLSIKYNNQVKHMRVCTVDNGQHYYLSETKYFKSIVELVNWYEENSLSESFYGLNIKLLLPYKKAVVPQSNGDGAGDGDNFFSQQAAATSVLSLNNSDTILIQS